MNKQTTNISQRYKKFIIYFLITLIIPLSFLFSPSPQEKTCSTYIPINKHMGYMLNCDSFGFIEAARNPSVLFEKDYMWQGRPLFIIMGSVIGYGIYPLINLIPADYFEMTAVKALPPIESPSKDKITTFTFYLAYIFLNFLFVFFSIVLLDLIIDLLADSKFPQNLKYLFSIFVASNLATKSFFLSPHLQMMIMFSPLLCCYVTLKTSLDYNFNYKKIIFIAFLIGFLNLVYGTFILILPNIIIALAYQHFRSKTLFNFIKQSIFISLAFILPSVLWIGTIIAKNGHFYSLDFSGYRQFVWIIDSLSISFSTFCDKFILNSYRYSETMLIILVPFLLFILLISINTITKKYEKNQVTLFWTKRSILILIFTLYFVFFWLMGFSLLRLTFTMFFILLCSILLELSILNKRFSFLEKKLMLIVSICIVLSWTVYNVFSYGPFE